ncbi:MAG: hypothetical protein C0405_05130 [Desulfovibrio sp.]|nr:hypothetical protein [Desulfovibrio sp.]
MKLLTFAATMSLLTLTGCAYLPSGSLQRAQSETPQNTRPAQAAATTERTHLVYKKGPGFVDPKIQPYTVMGKGYWPIQSGLGYREDGLASWYGIDFHGKKTATGEIYDMFNVSAAHKTLPLGTKVRVTNLQNGRELELLVNDRGPFVDGRIIDLSYASARLLGMADNGVARVRVEGIGENPALAGATVKTMAVASADSPPRRPKQQPIERTGNERTGIERTGNGRTFIERTIVEEPARAQAPQVLAEAAKPRQAAKTAPAPKAQSKAEVAQAESGKFAVQVGAFSQDDNARRVQTRLVQSGFGGARITRVVRGGKELLVVQAGAFAQREKAEEALRSLKAQFPASFISPGA